MTEAVRDRRRIIAAAAIALALHGVLFLLYPRVGLPADHTFDAPLYVALEPMQPEVSEQTPDDPETVPDTPEIEPEPEIEPDDNLAAIAPDTPASTPPAEADPDVDVPAAGTTGAVSERVPEPAPPPPRERTFDPTGLQPTTTDRAEIQAAQLREIATIQAEYLDALAEWEARQEESVATSGFDTDGSEPAEDVPSPRRLNDFQEELSALIDGIRTAANVVSTDATRDSESERQTDGNDPGADSDQPGSGDVTIEDAQGGTRRLLSDPTVDVSSVSLPGSFPPTYLAEVRFRVRADGYVESASVVRPSTVPALDRVLEETVRSWRFEPASGSSRVKGSVTILIDTTD